LRFDNLALAASEQARTTDDPITAKFALISFSGD
jgi:hypothetical protein